MALAAALAAALTALGAAMAVGGFRLGTLTISPAVYAMALVPGLISVARGRRVGPLRKVNLSPSTLRVFRFGIVGLGMVLISAHGVPDRVGQTVATSAALWIVGLSAWWPSPSLLRACVALSAITLVRPDANPRSHIPALVLMGVGAAVALVSCNRQAASGHRVLGGTRAAPQRPPRLAAETLAVGLALLLGAVLAARMDAPPPRPDQPHAGADPKLQPPAPLGYSDTLDPAEAGAGRGGGDPNKVLLRVTTVRAGVLRAITFDRWDGRRWTRDDTTRTRRAPRGFVPLFGARDEGRFPGNISDQHIRVEAPYAAVAVGTPRVYSYDLPVGAEVGLDNTVRLVPPVGRGATYTAQTADVQASPDQLRAAGAGDDHGGGLTAPPSDRSRALAERITAEAPTDYDKVKALSDYLAAHVTINTSADPLKPDADPIDATLFGTQTASPERLATVLAVLTRAVGIPSRLATGFLPGQRPFFGGDFVVRVRDAHTWVEVPFSRLGWQRFDPSGRIAEAERQDSLWSRVKRAGARFWPFIVAVLVLVAAFAVRFLVRRRRRLAAIPWATRYFARLERLGAKRGRSRQRAETPSEYTTVLAEGVLAEDRLVEVGRVVTEAAWSGRQPAEATRDWAETVLEEAAEASRPARRLRRSRATRTQVGVGP